MKVASSAYALGVGTLALQIFLPSVSNLADLTNNFGAAMLAASNKNQPTNNNHN